MAKQGELVDGLGIKSCPHCNGAGKVKYYHGDMDTCPSCHGTGRVPKQGELIGGCQSCGGSGKESVDWQAARELGWTVAQVEAERGPCLSCHGLMGVDEEDEEEGDGE